MVVRGRANPRPHQAVSPGKQPVRVLPAEPVPDQLQRCRRQDHQINLSRVTPPGNRIFSEFLSRDRRVALLSLRDAQAKIPGKPAS